MNDNVYEITSDIYKTFSSTAYTGKNLKNESDIWMMDNYKKDITYTGIREKPTERKSFFLKNDSKISWD